jgi:ATP-binding cassette subfamily B (MDR/TAP) protein 1
VLGRFYDPVTGRIACDDYSLVDLCPHKYQRDMSLVQQEPVPYQSSTRDNIAMGTETDVTDVQIEAGAKQPNITDFVASLPKDLSTMCSSKGKNYRAEHGSV